MRDALEIDGPTRHTRAAVKRALDLNTANGAGPSNQRRGYEIQLPSDSTEELDHLIKGVGTRSNFLAIVPRSIG